MSNTPIPAPKIASQKLWAMSSEEFNSWRSAYDFPRIIEFFNADFKGFSDWQKEQRLTDGELCEFGIGRFIRPREAVYICTAKQKYSPRRYISYEQRIVRPEGSLAEVKKVLPYLRWAKLKKIRVHPESRHQDLMLTGWVNATPIFMRRLELLCAGGVRLGSNYMFSGRNLDFMGLDSMSVSGEVWNNSYLNLNFCSVDNLQIRVPHFAFIDAYKCNFGELEIVSSKIQDWHFEDCSVSGFIRDSKLLQCGVTNCGFSPLMDNTDLIKCQFSYAPKYSSGVSAAHEFYGMLRRQYASRGKYLEAGEYYCLERKYERKMYFNPFFYFPQDFPPKREYNGTYYDLWGLYQEGHFDWKQALSLSCKLTKYYYRTAVTEKYLWRAVKYWAKYISSLLQFVWWGYGERPGRLLWLSGSVILVSALGYYLYPASATKGNLFTSLYYSAVTFITLGDGNITQTGKMRAIVALEALLGALNMGMFVSSLSQKSKY